MWQRIQTVYLFIAALAIIIFLILPSGTSPIAHDAWLNKKFDFYAMNDVFAAATGIAVFLLSIISIFLFKNRKLQIRLSYISIALSIVTITIVYFSIAGSNENYTLNYFIAIPVVTILFLFLAIRAIKKDQALIRSMNRMR